MMKKGKILRPERNSKGKQPAANMELRLRE